MTTYESVLAKVQRSSRGQVVLSILAPVFAALAVLLLGLGKWVERFALPVAGLTCLVVAAWIFRPMLGLVVLGISFFVLDYGRRK